MRLPAVAPAATIGRRGAGGAARLEEVRQPVEFARLRMNRPAANTPARMTKPAAFEEAENRIRESVNALGCEALGAWIESLDDGALRVERAGQRRFRVAAPPSRGQALPKTIMSTLGPVTYRRGISAGQWSE